MVLIEKNRALPVEIMKVRIYNPPKSNGESLNSNPAFATPDRNPSSSNHAMQNPKVAVIRDCVSISFVI
jgi:hypothetical protein